MQFQIFTTVFKFTCSRFAAKPPLKANKTTISILPKQLRLRFGIGPSFLQSRYVHTSTREPTSHDPCRPHAAIGPVPLAAARRFILELVFLYTRTAPAWHHSGIASLTWLCGALQRFPQNLHASRAVSRFRALGSYC